MFHIIKSVLVRPDIFVCERPGFIVTNFTDYEYAEDLMQCVDNADERYLVSRFTVFEELMNAHAHSFRQFLLYLISIKQSYLHFEIYASKDAYAQIVAHTIKALYKNCGAEQAYLEYKLSLDKQWYLYKQLTYSDTTIYTKERLPIDPKADLARVSKEEFLRIFEAANPDDCSSIVAKYPDMLTTEHQLARYLIDGSNEVEILSRFKNCAMKGYLDLIEELYCQVQYRWLDNDYTKDISESYIDIPKIAYTVLNSENRLASINEVNQALLSRSASFDLTHCYTKQLCDVLYSIASSTTLKECIDNILSARQKLVEDPIFAFGSKEKYSDKINQFFLYYILQLYSNNDIETLKKFAI